MGSHAGAGLEKLDDPADLAGYLARQPGEAFYVQPFVDYAGPDGRFRKLRIALVDGRPFIVHMAVSDHWMVHYLNAGMAEDAGKRAEEAAMMAGFETGFAARHADAFEALHAAFGLDYFAIDCAEDRDGPAAALRGRHRHDRPRHGSARTSTPTNGPPWSGCSRRSRR